MHVAGFDIEILVQGFPGKSVCHGGLGWSTVVLLRGEGRIVLIDTGSFNMRRLIVNQLERHHLSPTDITDVLLTHAHYDHSINWIMFANARIVIGAEELSWAMAQPFGDPLVPELYIRDLALSPRAQTVRDGEQVFPGMTAHVAPGHTPGHLIFVLSSLAGDVIFTGDAAKNRAELISGIADMTMNKDASVASIARIWQLWRQRPDTILVPGHDVPMVLENQRPTYIEARRAGITAWFDDNLEQTTLFELKATEPAVRRAARR
jgi:N-acyl homoserine lactone hydrolase